MKYIRTKCNVWLFLSILISWSFYFAFVSFEYYPRLIYKIKSYSYHKYIKQNKYTYLNRIKNVVREQLERPPTMLVTPIFFQFRIERYLRRTCQFDISGWPMAVLALGLVDSKESEDIDCLERFCSRLIDEKGKFKTKLKKVDECMIGYTLLYLFEYTNNIKYKIACDEIANYLVSRHQRSSSGLIPYRSETSNELLVDTLAMICPFLARYGVTFDNKEAVNLAVNQITQFWIHGIEQRSGLLFHGYIEGGGSLGIAGWSRGVGWFGISISDLLAYLPKGHPVYDRLKELFLNFATAVRKYQNEDGLFAWNLKCRSSHFDTSGSAMIGYSIIRGIEIGALGKEFLSIPMQVIKGLITQTDSNGFIAGALADSGGVGIYPQVYEKAVWVQGPATALVRRAYNMGILYD